MNKKLFLVAMALVLVAVAGTFLMTRAPRAWASDHDDGETDTKSRNSNLTDVYTFRKGDQTGNTADNSNLIIAVNVNPRSLPRQQYFFSQTDTYTVHIGQQTASNTLPTGISNIDLHFTFGAPNATTGQQSITLQRVNLPNNSNVEDTAAAVTVAAGQTQLDEPGIGTADPTSTGINQNITVDGQNLTVFAGLREDPFFFDVTQFFRVRAGALGDGPVVGFRTSPDEVDFTKDYNVLSLVLDVPIAFLQQGNANINTFDVFATIEQPQ